MDWKLQKKKSSVNQMEFNGISCDNEKQRKINIENILIV